MLILCFSRTFPRYLLLIKSIFSLFSFLKCFQKVKKISLALGVSLLAPSFLRTRFELYLRIKPVWVGFLLTNISSQLGVVCIFTSEKVTEKPSLYVHLIVHKKWDNLPWCGIKFRRDSDVIYLSWFFKIDKSAFLFCLLFFVELPIFPFLKNLIKLLLVFVGVHDDRANLFISMQYFNGFVF